MTLAAPTSPPAVEAPRRRLLFAIDSMTGGGAQRVLATLAAELRARGHSVEVLATFEPTGPTVSWLADLADTDGVPSVAWEYRRAPPRIGNGRRRRIMESLLGSSNVLKLQHARELLVNHGLAARRLGRQLEKRRIDCILSFLSSTNLVLLGARLFSRLQVPIVCADHNYTSLDVAGLPVPALRKGLMRALYPFATHHVAMTDRAADDLHRFTGVRRDNITTICNGIDIQLTHERGRQPLPSPYNAWMRDGRFHFVAVGRLVEQKALDVAIRAFHMVRKRVDARLTLVGNGPVESALRELVASLGLQNNVCFAGWQTNPHAFVKAADAFVLSSDWEGLPMTLLEALALGTPVIATDCLTGPREILDGGAFGKLVPTRDTEALARAMLELASDVALRERLARAASQRANRFSHMRMADDYERLIERCIRGCREHAAVALAAR